MNYKKTLSFLIFTFSFAFTHHVSATLIELDHTNLNVASSTAYNSITHAQDDINLEIFAYTIENDGAGLITDMALLTGNNVGVYASSSDNLGVKSNNSDGSKLDGGDETDPLDLDEGLLFVFDRLVSLQYINFDSFSGDDDFNLTVDGVLIVADYHQGHTSTFISDVSGQADEYNFFNVTGKEFLIWADSDSDAFKIDRIRVAKVPEPSSIFLFMVALLGFTTNRRAK